MGSKRAHSEVEAPGPSRDGGYKKRKQFKNNRPTTRSDGTSAPLGQSLNEVKKRARDIQRRFAKADNMPADIQRNLERELAHCKRQIEDIEHKKQRSEMIGKYHHVRFFERQKAERLRKQLKKRLDQAEPEDKAKLEEEYHIANVDWHYAKYFPFMERYIGMYPTAKTTDESDDKPIAKRALHTERPPMWKEIETAMEQGQRALEAIQERAASRPMTRSQDGSEKRLKDKAPKERLEPNEVKGPREKKDQKDKKNGKSKPGETKHKAVAVQGGEKHKQEKEAQVAEEGNDGMGFFA
ncbi:hypothetical protein N0V93_005210 [Gnomoniopsis smithogilvyi]|uniref:rRNA-processing protein EFG1 n=1 Tax=Gnomoniopsis smithogilvyi TaxID=1191159 RepID=A0A9W8YU25_9PEZI|nr:hypothetical protein N0V93_005210 [Gnomoniopsis smithogilvyi]